MMTSSHNVAIVKFLLVQKLWSLPIVFVLMKKEIFYWQQWYWGAIDATLWVDDLW